MVKNILILSGEESGDKLGEDLVHRIKTIDNNVHIAAMGGCHLKNAGAEIILDSSKMAIIGFIEVIKHIKVIRKAAKIIKRYIKTEKPDLVIAIDYPGFNLRMAKFAKKYNCKVIFYVSPQIWAWRYKRIFSIKRCVDLMSVLFPFEIQIYKDHNIPVAFEPHPLTKKVCITASKESMLQQLSIDTQKPIVGLMPGSRQSEINLLLPVMLKVVDQLITTFPNIRFILPLVDKVSLPNIPEKYSHYITITKNDTYNSLGCCDLVLACSGTATLELTLLNIPHIIIYKTHYINYILAKMLVKSKFIGLTNILAQQSIVKEFIQNQAHPISISQEVYKILSHTEYKNQMTKKLKEITEAMQHQTIDDDFTAHLTDILQQS